MPAGTPETKWRRHGAHFRRPYGAEIIREPPGAAAPDYYQAPLRGAKRSSPSHCSFLFLMPMLKVLQILPEAS